MTYTVCHLLASKDRCEPPCLCLSDWWLVSLLSVSTLSQPLVLSAVAILRKWQRVICMLTCHETGLDRCAPFLTLPSSTPLNLSGSHSSLNPAPASPDFGLSYGVRRVWLELPRLILQSVLLLSKVFHGGLSKAGFLLSSVIHAFRQNWVFKVCEGKIGTK